MNNNEDIGLVALDSQIIGNRRTSNKNTNTKCGITNTNLYNLFDNIIIKINNTVDYNKKIIYNIFIKIII